MNIKGGYQDSQFEGGVQAIPNAIAVELGDSVVLDSPVSAITQGDDAFTVTSRHVTVKARRTVLALPRMLTSGIQFDPVLPADHVQLIHAMPAGTEYKLVAVYDEPFWRHDGVSGASVATDDTIEITLDTCQPGHPEGVIAGYCAGPRARQLAQLSQQERHDTFVKTLTTRFGPKAAAPQEILENNWAEEPWTRGCSMARFPNGVLTQYGRLLREPVGRLHWAGTETATTSYGAMDGAVRSGERVSEEILGHSR
jgi:monoamine oxidase